MNIGKIKKIIKSNEWKEEESQASVHVLDHWKTCYLDGNKAYGRKLYSHLIYSGKNNYFYEWVPARENENTFKWVAKKFRDDKKYFLKKFGEFKETSRKIDYIFERVHKDGLLSFSNAELADLMEKIYFLGKKQYGYALLPETIDTFTEADYVKILNNIQTKKVLEVVRILSTLPELSFIEREKLDLLKLAGEAGKDKLIKKAIIKKRHSELKKSPFWKKFENHKKKYFWIQNSFRQARYLSVEYFIDLAGESSAKSDKWISREIRKLKNKAKITKNNVLKTEKNYKLSREARTFFELVRNFVFLQDRRKESVQKIVYCIDQIFNETQKRLGISKKKLDNYFVFEITNLLRKRIRVSGRKLRERRNITFFSYLQNGKIKTDYLFGSKSNHIINYFKKQRKKIAESGQIRGFVASLGKSNGLTITGKVRIVFDPRKNKFKKGEILVAGMTRPEFLPLMKKAKAVITNEGGITTHAAIVSRELGIPCIIGTKIATDVLKNGEVVEMDLKSGFIRKAI